MTQPQQKIKKSKGKILFVEDDPFLAEMFRQKFVIDGYVPIIAHTAISAVLALRDEKPDAIILDVVLPDSECWMIMEYLMRKKDWTPVPILIVTNWDNDDYRRKAKAMKADAYIFKAASTPSELVKTMEALIRKKKKERPQPYQPPVY